MCLDLYATLDRDCCRTCDAQQKKQAAGDREYQGQNMAYMAPYSTLQQ